MFKARKKLEALHSTWSAAPFSTPHREKSVIMRYPSQPLNAGHRFWGTVVSKRVDFKKSLRALNLVDVGRGATKINSSS